MSEKIKIIYIVGVGHSGSTLLDRIIGSANNVFSVGALWDVENFLNKFENNKDNPKFQDQTKKDVYYFWKPVSSQIKNVTLIAAIVTLSCQIFYTK